MPDTKEIYFSRGSKGQLIIPLKKALNGFIEKSPDDFPKSDKLAVNDLFCPKTETAVKEFQASQHPTS